MKSLYGCLVAAIGATSILGGAANAADIYQGGSVVPSATGVYFTSQPTMALVNLTQGFINIDCTFEVWGDITKDANGDFVITVTNAVSSSANGGSALCPGVTFQFPWIANVPAANVPVPAAGGTTSVTFNDVYVSTFLGDCEGPVTATYGNGPTITNTSASFFDFNDTIPPVPGDLYNCAVDGEVETTTPYATNDVDVY